MNCAAILAVHEQWRYHQELALFSYLRSNIAVALMLRLRRGKAEQLHCVVELLDPPLLLQYTWN